MPMLDPDRTAFLKARQRKTVVTVPAWPREDKDLPQVELPVEWVRFSTLNHRTKAEQLREIRKRGRDDLFSADPLGPEAQEAQFDILCAQEKFVDLKSDLKERPQQEPAIVTADGVLINGNRRAAALRSLSAEGSVKHQYVRCLVLPDDATADELLFLETELQVARDFKKEYSWINEALMIEDLYERADLNWEHVAVRMHKPVGEVRQQHEKLLLVHQLVERSEGARLHVDFTENESAFEELAKHIRSKPAREKESVKDAYFLGILTGTNYRSLRHLRRSDASDLVARELSKEPTLRAVLDAATPGGSDLDEADPLSDLLGEEEPEAPLGDLVTLVATTRPEAGIVLPGGERAAMENVLGSLSAAVAAAADEADEQTREQDTVQAPLKRADKAVAELARIPTLLEKARTYPNWEEEAFLQRVERLEKVLAEIRERS